MQHYEIVLVSRTVRRVNPGLLRQGALLLEDLALGAGKKERLRLAQSPFLPSIKPKRVHDSCRPGIWFVTDYPICTLYLVILRRQMTLKYMIGLVLSSLESSTCRAQMT